MESSGLLCPDNTLQYEPPNASVISIHRFCLAISLLRNDLPGCVKSGEQHIIEITLPCASTSFLNRIQFFSSLISIKPAYHSRPSISSCDASAIHSETFIVPSLQSACI